MFVGGGDVQTDLTQSIKQVFGSEPPPVLYQITRLNHDTWNLPSSSTDSNLSASRPQDVPSEDSMGPPDGAPLVLMPAPEQESLKMAKQQRLRTSLPMSPVSDVRSAIDSIASPNGYLSAEPEKDFRRRRLQAAKLTNFFGVGHHDLKPSIIAPPLGKSIAKSVGNTKTAFWDRHQRKHENEVEMKDVIQALRLLKTQA
jgi:hypothetical protein